MAPVYIMRLWAHCQNRKGDTFTIPCAGIKALCKFAGDAATFEKALIDAEYLSRNGDSVTVIGWAERNASLIAAWENGGKGGRPKKPTENPQETHGKPNGNPAVTQGEPDANPRETDKSREDKSSTSSLRSEGEAVASAPKRASRKCPDSFTVTDDLVAWAQGESPGVDLARETAKFRDHTFKNAISDWPAAWRNWIRGAVKFSAINTRPSKHTGFDTKDYTAGVNADGTLV